MRDTITVYILKQDNWFISYDIFTEKDARHYFQYRKKWEDKYTTKYWVLDELVWEYEDWDDKIIVELITREIII